MPKTAQRAPLFFSFVWERVCKGQAASACSPGEALSAPGGLSLVGLFHSDGEAPGGNPMVAGFQDDLDLDDKIPSRAMLAAERVPSKNITLSSEEEEEEEEELKDAKATLIAEKDTDVEQEKKR